MRELSVTEVVHVGGAGITTDVFANIGSKIGWSIGKTIASAIPFLSIHIYKPLGNLGSTIGNKLGSLFGSAVEAIFSNPKA